VGTSVPMEGADSYGSHLSWIGYFDSAQCDRNLLTPAKAFEHRERETVGTRALVAVCLNQ